MRFFRDYGCGYDLDPDSGRVLDLVVDDDIAGVYVRVPDVDTDAANGLVRDRGFDKAADYGVDTDSDSDDARDNDRASPEFTTLSRSTQ